MKVAILIQDFFGNGAQYAMAAVARGLVAKGVAVDLLVSKVHQDILADPADKRKPFALPDEATIIKLPSRRARANIWSVRCYLRRTDAIAVLSTSGPYHRCLRYAAIGLWRCPMLVNVDHANWWPDLMDVPLESIPPAPLLKRFLHFFYYAGFSRKFFVNERSRQVFIRRCPCFGAANTFTVYNPVIDDIFQEKVNRPPEHPWLRHKDCPVVIAVGSYAECKNHLMAMEAIRLVNQTRRVRLVIFGKGPLEESYRQYIEQHHLQDVISIGHFSSCVPAEMRAADVLVSSSLHESFSIVLVEALAAGTPVVSTDAPLGPREVLENGKYGKLVPIGDCSAMAKAILAQINEKGKPIPEEAWKRFTVESITARYLEGLKPLD